MHIRKCGTKLLMKLFDEAKKMGVEFVYDVDKQAFRDATADMITSYRNKYPGVDSLLSTIEKVRKGN